MASRAVLLVLTNLNTTDNISRKKLFFVPFFSSIAANAKKKFWERKEKNENDGAKTVDDDA